jgi:cell division protease FtsH
VIAYHESGHALCGELLPGVDRTHRISIIPRGTALGYTLHLPDEDRNLQTRAELIDEMTCLLGGRAAEQLVFGSITTGAAGDLKRVAAISRSMIHEWAMGTAVSALQLASEGGAVSDRTRELRDAEQQHLADEAMRRAVRLLTEHREQLDALALALLRQEVLERADIDRIMAGVGRPDAAAGHQLRVAAAQQQG